MSSKLLNLDPKALKLPAWLKIPAIGGGAADAGGGLRIQYPPVALSISVGSFTLARLARDKERKSWQLKSFEVVEVPSELIDTDVFQMRIRDPERMTAIVASAIGRGAERTEKISLVLPDHLARVALLNFEEIPRSRRDMIGMVKWKMKKAVPFKVDEAAVDYEILPSDGRTEGHTVLVVLMPLRIVEEHEAIFSSQGIRAGLIDLSTFSIAHLYRPIVDQEVPSDGDFMLLNATGTFLTAMIFRRGLPIFYRCKTFGFGGGHSDESNARLFHREVQASILYYQERLKGTELARVYMALSGHDPERVAMMFREGPVATKPELIDPRRVVSCDGLAGAGGEAGDVERTLQRLAPAIGAALGREPLGARPS